MRQVEGNLRNCLRKLELRSGLDESELGMPKLIVRKEGNSSASSNAKLLAICAEGNSDECSVLGKGELEMLKLAMIREDNSSTQVLMTT